MSKSFVRRNLDVVALVAFLALSAFTLTSGSQVGYWTAISFAAVGFILVQQPERGQEPDERDKFIAHRASSSSFSVVLVALVLFSLLSDFIPAIEALSTPVVLNGIIVVMYGSFSIAYAVLKRVH